MAAKRTAKKLTVSASQLLTKNMLRLTFHGDDRQVLPVPANIEVQWVINPQAGSDASPLFDAIKQLQWLDGQVAIWTACEFKTMKKIGHLYRESRSVHKSHLYISSYWKQGLKEEEHKVAKREDVPHTSLLRTFIARVFNR